MSEIAATSQETAPQNSASGQLTPREIVSELDRHIIGQAGAKRAVAIALRNRWRRMQLGEHIRAEITPKNMMWR